MDTDTLQIIIMVAGFAITIIIGLLRFPSRAEMNQRFDEMDQRFDEMNQRFDEMDQQFDEVSQPFGKRGTDVNQRLIDLSADVRNIYHILVQGKLGASEKDD